MAMTAEARDNPYNFLHAWVQDDALDSPLLQQQVSIAFGRSAKDFHWNNTTAPLREVIESLCHFERGQKDGRCILQGAVAGNGVQRIAANMHTNYIMMFDYDKGETIDQVAAKIAKVGLWAMLWTTHSNLKTQTLIPEKKIEAYMRQIGRRGENATDVEVLDYLAQSQKLLPEFVTAARVVDKKMMEGGVKWVVEHPPIPRLRALFVLKEPFDFAKRAGSQQKAMAEWKELYAGVSSMLDLPYDASCCDPSRLMYTPRIPDTAVIGEGCADIVIINGKALDLDTVPRKEVKIQKAEPPKNNFVRVAQHAMGTLRHNLDSGYTLTRPWLRRFAGLCGQHFEIARWLAAEFPDDIRGSKSGIRIEFKCPNEEGHTEQNPTDTAFFVEDADGDRGFGAHCRHDTCTTESGNDRLYFLDKLCAEYDINSADALLPYVFSEGQVAWLRAEQEDQKKAEARVATERGKRVATEHVVAATAGRKSPLDDQITALTSEPTAAALEAVLRTIASIDTESMRDTLVDKVHTVTGIRKPAIRGDIDTYREEAATQADPARVEVLEDMSVPEPEDRTKEDLVVWVEDDNSWTPTVQNDCVAKQIESKNAKSPRLFRRPEGGVIRVVPHPDGGLEVNEMDDDAWAHEVGLLVKFKKLSMTGRVKVLDPPAARVRDYRGRPDKNLPILERIVKVGVIGPDGALEAVRGYVPAMRIYLDPKFEALPVPVIPNDDDVEHAVNEIADILTDFPFSDDFSGDDQRPLKMLDAAGGPVLDPDGHPYPNPNRGKASFANMLAMILQPFVQHLVTGPSPAFHIDKAKAGTGAGYLVDMVYLIAEGKAATVKSMSDNNEEFKKTITATLRQGAPIIFIDNINRHVDSGALAAALTSGTWSDRVLGVSEMVDIPVKSVWVMAGNNLSFSHELMRRNVPIYMDAATPHPAQDRKKESFKYHPLQEHVERIRPRLVRAVHVLIVNWFAKGRPRGSVTMNSFDSWASTLGGILEAAGIEGFLSNIPAYLEVNDEEDSSQDDFANVLFARFGFESFKLEQALNLARTPMGVILFSLPIDPNDKEATMVTKLGTYVKNQMSRATFDVEAKGDGGWPTVTRVKLLRKKTKSGISLRFSAVSKKG